MQVFFVSIRTAMIFGPGEVLEASSRAGEQMYLRVNWPFPYAFDEWEGYAVVVPERNEVWGAAQPRFSDGELELEFAFSPQAIPPKELQMFTQQPAAPAAAGDSEDEDDSDED